eukprot:gene12255-8434_t
MGAVFDLQKQEDARTTFILCFPFFEPFLQTQKKTTTTPEEHGPRALRQTLSLPTVFDFICTRYLLSSISPLKYR